AGNSALAIFALAVLLDFLILAAQFICWWLPFAVLLIAPMSFLSAIVGVWVSGGDINIFTLIGFVVLVGLEAKYDIL
ncbi:efflux RND transporter permease subunit, partial [Salmonella enterica]|uniref:efflux RND transporter permease subunit n=1 Tax=Salmonella enterica TaxID=28901 RepID=UPI0020C2F2BF